MLTDLCFIYPWATRGGVERMLLNRMIAFKEFHPEIRIDIVFFCDAGGAVPLRRALKAHDVDVNVLVADDFKESKNYDVVFCIDCPQAFELCEQRGFSYVIECHSGYLESRNYLRNIPKTCERFVVVPSDEFAVQIKDEVGGMDIVTLRNFVPTGGAGNSGRDGAAPGWARRPLLYFARMDGIKNPLFILDAMLELEKVEPGKFFAVMCGAQMPEIDMQKEINRRGLHSSVMILPPVDFMRSIELMSIIKKSGGFFVSPSKNESFGLSAAEAISIGMPVLLSDIPAHRHLVSGREELVFSLDDPKGFCEKIKWLSGHYDEMSAKMQSLQENFSVQGFIDDWGRVMNRLRKV